MPTSPWHWHKTCRLLRVTGRPLKSISVCTKEASIVGSADAIGYRGVQLDCALLSEEAV